MSLDEPRRSISPQESSGRISPGPPAPRRQVEDEPRRQDKSYRRYATGIERALASFDTTRLEWPDYISFLGRLLKAIQAHPSAVDSLPHKAQIANRLSQCLTPALPSGVHQKALEVYSNIFSLIGKQSLALDLHIYLPGLSAVFTFASLSLRPTFLTLVETHILSLDGIALRPALKALILCLLPGLEDETSEDFVRSLKVVDGLRDAVSIDAPNNHSRASPRNDEFFWQCFFLAAISSSSRRQGALAFLTRRMPKLVASTKSNTFNSKETSENVTQTLPRAAEFVVSPEPGLLVRCLAAGLEDRQMLIKRGYLDLLLSHLPLHSPILTKRVRFDDLVHLVVAATGVVARRDMSLNRRLWAWFLGPSNADEIDEDPNSDASRPTASARAAEYFTKYGAHPLVSGLLAMFEQTPILSNVRAKPFRMCLSLMDHGEIGSIVIPQIFPLAMGNISKYSKEATDTDFQEVLRSASSFFDGIESGTIWGQIMDLSAIALLSDEFDDDKRIEKLSLARFIIENFNVHDEEMVFVHLPLVLLSLITASSEYSSRVATDPRPHKSSVLESALLLGDHLVQLLPERIQLNSSFADKEAELDESEGNSRQVQIVEFIKNFYSGSSGLLSLSPPPFSSKRVSELLLSEAAHLLTSPLRTTSNSSDNKDKLNIRLQAKILSALIIKLPARETTDLIESVKALEMFFAIDNSGSQFQIQFDNLKAICQLLIAVRSSQKESSDWFQSNFSQLISHTAKALWDCLSPTTPKHHLEAVRCLWQLDDLMFNESLTEALVSKFLTDPDYGGSRFAAGVDAARKFVVLWSHTPSSPSSRSRSISGAWPRSNSIGDTKSLPEDQNYQKRLFRPLCLLLDACDETETELQYFVQGWLQGLSNIDKIVEMLIGSIARNLPSSTTMQQPLAAMQVVHGNQNSLCLYFMRRMSSLLNLSSQYLWVSLSTVAEKATDNSTDEETSRTTLEFLARQCLLVIQRTVIAIEQHYDDVDNTLLRVSLSILQAILQSPDPSSLQKLKIEEPLIQILEQSLNQTRLDSSCQTSLLETILAALRVRYFATETRMTAPRLTHRPASSVETVKFPSKLSLAAEFNESSPAVDNQHSLSPPPQLIDCIQKGLTANPSFYTLETWVQFLSDVLPLFSSALFQNIIPLVDSICRRIKSMFEDLRNIFDEHHDANEVSPDGALIALLSALELTLIAGHEQMTADEPKRTGPKSPEPSQSGFFGNVVSGVFSSDSPKVRNATANTRLTVILCFQDTLRICLSIWSWDGHTYRRENQNSNCLASFAYVSQRLRNKTRRMLDRMFAQEPLECLETLITIWLHQEQIDGPQNASTISLLHVLEGLSPKRTMSAIFNAIYSRTNPVSVEGGSVSTLTSDLTEFEISQFLIEYTKSLDDDVMDEIWNDCMTFLRDILANPLSHHQILPNLLIFIVLLAEKVDKTNFGEQRKMRKDLGDLFLRYLTAIFTTKTGSSYQDIVHSRSTSELPEDKTPGKRRIARKAQYIHFIEVLYVIVPRLSAVLGDSDRLATAVSNITTNAISPLVHAKTFPANVKTEYLTLWLNLMKVNVDSKLLKKDISDAFMHTRFFSTEASLAVSHWSKLLYQWMLVDKDRITDVASRIFAPTSAGIMFGVGATAARLEADKKTQLNLRRIAFLVLAAEEDHAVAFVSILEEKIVDLLHASLASSPSSSTRAEVFMLLRALILKTNSMHLAPLWPILTFELQKALSSILSRSADFDTYNIASLLQACKLLDILLMLNPDDFQVYEWLFITDTIDSVYRPGHWEPVALADDLAEELNATSGGLESARSPLSAEPNGAQAAWTLKRTNTNPKGEGDQFCVPLLAASGSIRTRVTDATKDEFIAKVLRPFLAQLSLHAYESTYSMKGVDMNACITALVEDLFDDSTLVG